MALCEASCKNTRRGDIPQQIGRCDACIALTNKGSAAVGHTRLRSSSKCDKLNNKPHFIDFFNQGDYDKKSLKY